MTTELNLDMTVKAEKILTANLTNYGGVDLVANYGLITDLDNYVPYTGATKDIDIGAQNIVMTAGAGIIFQPIPGVYFRLRVNEDGEVGTESITP